MSTASPESHRAELDSDSGDELLHFRLPLGLAQGHHGGDPAPVPVCNRRLGVVVKVKQHVDSVVGHFVERSQHLAHGLGCDEVGLGARFFLTLVRLVDPTPAAVVVGDVAQLREDAKAKVDG